MDKETERFVDEIEKKYKGNKDVEFLLAQLTSLELKLISADVMAMMVDIAVRRKAIDERGGIADARLNYGMPWQYEFAPEKLLLEYKGGIPEVVDALSKQRH